MVVCNCSMFCCTLLYVHSSIAIILMGKRELGALLNLPSWCLMMVEWLFLAVPLGCLQFVIVVFPDHTNLLFLISHMKIYRNHTCFHALIFAEYPYPRSCLRASVPTSLKVPSKCLYNETNKCDTFICIYA